MNQFTALRFFPLQSISKTLETLVSCIADLRSLPCVCMRSKALLGTCLVAATLFLMAPLANASLIGTEVSLRVLAQATPDSEPIIASFERTVIVSAEEVEYPNVASLFNPDTVLPPGYLDSLVNLAIDIGADYIETDFANAGFGFFAFGHENTSIFRFDSASLVNITGAVVDETVTTSGLTNSRLRFEGNELFVNVQGLSYNPFMFTRINLTVVPEPASIILFLVGVAGLLGMVWKKIPTARTLQR